jgi:uncharacterized protein (DUF433 family)
LPSFFEHKNNRRPDRQWHGDVVAKRGEVMTSPPDQPIHSEIILYQTEDGQTKIQVRLENETVWLTQADMAQLFQTSPPNITLHLKNIFQEGELAEEATCKDFLQVQIEGSRKIQRSRRFYNLDAIISVGYRIKSHVADSPWMCDIIGEPRGSKMSEEKEEQGGLIARRITMNPEICHGKPCIRGLRYPVETILELLSSGMTVDEILADYDDLEREDILAALAFAARLSQIKRLQPTLA